MILRFSFHDIMYTKRKESDLFEQHISTYKLLDNKLYAIFFSQRRCCVAAGRSYSIIV